MDAGIVQNRFQIICRTENVFAVTVLARYGRVCIIHLLTTGEKSFYHRDGPRKISLCSRWVMGFLSSFGIYHDIVLQISNFPSAPPPSP